MPCSSKYTSTPRSLSSRTYHDEYDRNRLVYSLRAYEPKFIYAAGKAEKELRGVKRYVNLFYRIYNGRRRHEILPMKF